MIRDSVSSSLSEPRATAERDSTPRTSWIRSWRSNCRDDTLTLANTRRLADIRSEDYAGLFMVGGSATVWDFPNNSDLKRIIEEYFPLGKVIAGVCHGVIGLTQAVDANGEPLVKNRKVTSISNAEDVMMGLDKVVPVLPEEMLRKLRGVYSCAAPLAEHVVIDAPLFTGQNPASADPLGVAIVKYLDRMSETAPEAR